ncbi:hypothetical protein PF010_g31062 [Phytophthora fragariae]|uniref:Uncharacterized protein n=1 Tax=Phytophthora fragariae TaxID=53985 RepID=A0A6A3GNJ0_9STRA|nr:hypothetical protein PF011_g30693 [Phytophthora fragariae]KAE9058269.1 hypothetical protein PF010_g31062 [Phytophthora fragariae]KAE9161925.1 hypothetical protein PF004_g30660 [Phytophthora fragariae]
MHSTPSPLPDCGSVGFPLVRVALAVLSSLWSRSRRRRRYSASTTGGDSERSDEEYTNSAGDGVRRDRRERRE